MDGVRHGRDGWPNPDLNMPDKHYIIGVIVGDDFFPYDRPLEVRLLGNTLRDWFDGTVQAVKDEYGEWVNPRLKRIGIRQRLEVRKEVADGTEV